MTRLFSWGSGRRIGERSLYRDGFQPAQELTPAGGLIVPDGAPQQLVQCRATLHFRVGKCEFPTFNLHAWWPPELAREPENIAGTGEKVGERGQSQALA